MIEETVLSYLREKLEALNPPIDAYMEKEQDLPSEYVLIEKTGSRERDKIRFATFAVQSYAGSMYRAAELNESVLGWMENLPYERDIFSCELNSDYNFTDVTTREYRYQAVFEIVY